MQLTFLVTSPRVAPGLMSWPAWQAVASAERVLASDDTSPLFRAVTAAGHRVDVLPEPSAADLLDAAASASGTVVWLADDEESTTLTSALATEIVTAGSPAARAAGRGAARVVRRPRRRVLDLVAVMDRLRTSCPWDREQTHRSLATYLLEETYETLEAIDTEDYAHLREELGDLLLQVVFHARIAEEDPDDPFTVDDVAGGIVDKLVHRHPHVFAGLDVADADEVEANWDRLKAAEKGRGSVLDGIPAALPALALADKVAGRAGKLGVTRRPGRRSATGCSRSSWRRAAGLDAEQELRDAVRRLADAVRTTETR